MYVEPFLIFPGTCRDALDFYAEALGGKITHIQTVGDSPLAAAPEHADRVFNAIFAADGLRLRASDGEPGRDPVVGQNFAMFVVCPNEGRQERIFSTLADGGRVLFPLRDGFGMVVDRFAVQWMIDIERP